MKKNALLSIFMLSLALTSFGQMLLNHAVPDGRVDSVWNGINLPQAFTGEGVIVGLTDWGFDYTHPVFYDTNMVNYRVLRAWDQYKLSGPAPAGFDYGTEYVGAEQLLAAGSDTSNCYDYHYHGTHCASIAAGGGAGKSYRGVAFGAELIFVSLYLDDPHYVIDAWRWMYDVAQQEGKRLVISMSWGVYFLDNMDGTGELANEVRRLTDLGVVFVSSAGNNGDVNFHLGYQFTERDTIRSYFAYPYNDGSVWGSSLTMTSSANSPFEFSLMAMDNGYNVLAETPFISTAANDGYVDTFMVVNGDTLVYNYDIQSTNIYNQAPNVRLRVKRSSSYKFALAVTAENGHFHAWNIAETTKAYGNWGGDFVTPGLHPDWLAGDIEYGISTPANIDEIITVAAHQKRYQNNAGHMIGGPIADFSSSGPGFHEVTKPDVSAPGKNIIAAISSYTTTYTGNYTTSVEFNGRTYRFASLSGTSMSGPFVAGVAALVLQANPYLSTEQVRNIINETAYQDEFTEEDGVKRFGNGKVDAYHAVLMALNTVGVQEHVQVAESNYTVFPNPSNGRFYVTALTESPEVSCAIYDLSGRMVGHEMLTAGVNSINLQNMPAGCYLLKITDDQKVITKKLIVNP
ncbi:MAG: S8 family peptidase [Bacteroidales bacterium]|nr:S8 family peptidase [Bacteroidales bacterium]